MCLLDEEEKGPVTVERVFVGLTFPPGRHPSYMKEGWDEERGVMHVVNVLPTMLIREAVEHVRSTGDAVVAHDDGYSVRLYEDDDTQDLRVSFQRRNSRTEASRDFQEDDYRALTDLRFER